MYLLPATEEQWKENYFHAVFAFKGLTVNLHFSIVCYVTPQTVRRTIMERRWNDNYKRQTRYWEKPASLPLRPTQTPDGLAWK